MNYMYTVKILLINVEFFVKIQATSVNFAEEMGTKYLLIFGLTSLF